MAEPVRETVESSAKMAKLPFQMVKFVRAFQTVLLGGFLSGSTGLIVVYDKVDRASAFIQPWLS